MLKKGIIMLSIMVGISVGGIITNKPAHAKKDATITKISTNLKESSSYMTFTGKNALYTKAATMQGAKLVKSKAQLTQLAESKRGLDSFMWLRTATTNRGTVYFKVASFDYKIKGWIYAGRTTNYRLGLIYYLDEQHKNPAGGVADFHTMTDVAMTPEQKQSFYKLANPGTSSDGTAKVYSLPFDVAPITVTNFINMPNKKTSTPYKNDIFIIQKVVKNTRQGDVWYSVDDLNNDIMATFGKAASKNWQLPRLIRELPLTLSTLPTIKRSARSSSRLRHPKSKAAWTSPKSSATIRAFPLVIQRTSMMTAPHMDSHRRALRTPILVLC